VQHFVDQEVRRRGGVHRRDEAVGDYCRIVRRLEELEATRVRREEVGAEFED
jgi:hypothetical protein